MKIYGIVGTFFQEGESLQIVNHAESEGGTHVKVAEQAMSHAFSGHFMQHDTGYGEGALLDAYGASHLGIEELSDDRLVFQKTYQRTGTIVTYFMIKQEDGVWAGQWRSLQSGGGQARCKLVELPEEMFNIQPIETISDVAFDHS